MKWISLIFLLVSLATYSQEYEDLDGIYIKALDEYPSVKKNETTLGVNLLPADPYFYGVGLSGSYTRYLSKKWGWEVLSANFVFQIEKSLTNALADKGVQADSLESTSYILASNMRYVLSYGKNIFLDKYIRMNRTELLMGVGTIGTNVNNYISINLGVQFDFAINEEYSWKVELMNYTTFQRDRGEIFDFASIKAMLAWRFK
jgi:hypothetical protein